VLARLPFNPRFLGSDPAEDDEFVTMKRNPQHDYLRRGSKAVGPMSKT
jgi:hypothetical protein